MRFTINMLLLACFFIMTQSCSEQPKQKEMLDAETSGADSSIEKPAPVKRPVEVLDLTDEVALFVVVAGAYSSPEGAKRKASELQELGYGNADIIQRPGSKLFSALVERFDNAEEAEAFSLELLSNDEIKSYVYQVK